MRYPAYRWYWITLILAMMADNIEHVISYWVMFHKFHSPALGGFAVVSHWVPFFLFSMPMGALADRMDPRRLIQFGLCLFVGVSLGWGYFFATDSLQMWEAMLLLVIHGCAGVFWQTPSQLLLHSLVEQEDLQSAVRLSATARYLGVLVGPALGGAMLVWLGPIHGIFLNAFYFIPTILWLAFAPFHRDGLTAAALRGIDDIVRTVREIAARPSIVTVSLLAAASAALIGSSYQAQMPNFAVDLGHGDPGTAYSALLAADAAWALTGGIMLETFGGFATATRTAILLAIAWAIALGSFALTHTYGVALACLFVAGFFELSFSSMAQTIVQIEAPAQIRGRVIGVYAMASLGCRAMAGITVGVVGAALGVHWSLAIAAAGMFVVGLGLLTRTRSVKS